MGWPAVALAAVGSGDHDRLADGDRGGGVYQFAGSLITAGPLGFWAAPDVPMADVPPGWWANVRLAPRWADYVLTARVTDGLVPRLGPGATAERRQWPCCSGLLAGADQRVLATEAEPRPG